MEHIAYHIAMPVRTIACCLTDLVVVGSPLEARKVAHKATEKHHGYTGRPLKKALKGNQRSK
eukprot:2055367-Amphidinium_carterae.1